jgi:DNA end-binding protein Ku
MAAHSVWKGFVSFGLLQFPVKLYVAARDKRVELHKYHIACNTNIKMPPWCPKCQVHLKEGEIYKGYEAGKGIIPLGKEEIEAITPATERQMEVREFVDFKDVDPVFLAESYYLLPEDAGVKAYSLLAKILQETGKCAIAQICKHSREHVALIRPKGTGLALHFLWYPAEISQMAEFDNFNPVAISAAEVKLGKQLVESMSNEFDPSQYEDGYLNRMNLLIQSKMDKSVAAPEPVKVIARADTIDISSALTASLAAAKPKKAAPKAKKSKVA